MKKILKTTLFIIFGLIVVGTFVFLWSKSRVKEVEYEMISAETKTIQKKTVITGKVEPRNEVAIKPQISGIVIALYKEAGQLVKAGDVIAKVQVIPDISQLNSAESRLNVANINLDQAKSNYERIEKLYKSKVSSKEAYEQALTSYKSAKEEVANATESIQIIKEGISQKTAQYSNTLIKATVSGMILDIPVKVGNSVIQSNNFNDGTTIATIANMGDLIFIGQVDETEVGKIKEGDPVVLIIGAMQDARFDAVLEYIAPKGSVENGATVFSIKAAVTLNKDGGFIRSGYSANGEVITQKVDSVVAIPEYALEFSGDSAFVYVENPGNKKEKFKKVPVKVGLSDGFYIQIKEGITLNTKIRGKAKLQNI